jgi:hypothetical protein
MPTVKNTRGTIKTALDTELNSMANNANVLSSAVAFESADQGMRFVEGELLVTFGTNPSANTAFCVWLLREVDGTNYEDGGASVTPTRPPDMIFTVRAVTTAQRIVQTCDLPPGAPLVLIRNDGTGQAIAASGNTFKLRPVSESF